MGAISNQSPDTNSSGLNIEGEVAFSFDLANGQSGLAVWSEAGVDGDFDGDGDVDGRDFLAWQRGESPAPLSAEDLAEWQANYNTPELGALAVSIPEPATVMLVSLSLLGLGKRCGSV